jgi:GNAT superfamily N-acetyltransferase
MIRRVEPRDVGAVVRLVHELALHEKAPEQCHLTAEQLHTALFDDSPALFGHVAEVDGEVVGIALWFLNFSTWDGVHGIYLEDLYVTPEHRGSGIGRQLLETLARECVAKGYTRFQWWVLNWNEPSIGFYKKLGAVPMDEWTVMRVADEALQKLGSAL